MGRRRRGGNRRGAGMGRRGRRPVGVRRRRRGRRLIRGGSVLLMIGGAAAAYKLGQSDVERIETHTKKSADDLTEAELLEAMKMLGIKNLELSEEDEKAVQHADSEDEPAEKQSASQESDAIIQLRQLGELRDSGILTNEEFETKKAEILDRI